MEEVLMDLKQVDPRVGSVILPMRLLDAKSWTGIIKESAWLANERANRTLHGPTMTILRGMNHQRQRTLLGCCRDNLPLANATWRQDVSIHHHSSRLNALLSRM